MCREREERGKTARQVAEEKDEASRKDGKVVEEMTATGEAVLFLES